MYCFSFPKVVFLSIKIVYTLFVDCFHRYAKMNAFAMQARRDIFTDRQMAELKQVARHK